MYLAWNYYCVVLFVWTLMVYVIPDCNTTEIKESEIMNIEDRACYLWVQKKDLQSEGGTLGNSDEEEESNYIVLLRLQILWILWMFNVSIFLFWYIWNSASLWYTDKCDCCAYFTVMLYFLGILVGMNLFWIFGCNNIFLRSSLFGYKILILICDTFSWLCNAFIEISPHRKVMVIQMMVIMLKKKILFCNEHFLACIYLWIDLCLFVFYKILELLGSSACYIIFLCFYFLVS